MRDHKKLKAFEFADNLVLEIYMVTKKFPKEEIYGLTSQMRRAAISVPSNIVEGCARSSQLEYHRFLEIAFGSLRELHYQFTIAKRLNYIDKEYVADLEAKFNEAEKVLSGLIISMRSK